MNEKREKSKYKYLHEKIIPKHANKISLKLTKKTEKREYKMEKQKINSNPKYKVF